MKNILYSTAIILLLSSLISCNSDMVEKGMDSIADPRRPDINVKQGETDIHNHDTFPLAFANGVKINEISEPQIFTIENLGSADLEITQLAIQDNDNNDFILEEPSSTIIAAGTNRTFTISFAPLDTDSKSATVVIQSNDEDEAEYSFTITADAKPIPDFSTRLRYGCEPLIVNFQDKSVPQGDITSWAWDFNGDGIIDDTSQNPTYKYTSSGTYSVILSVSGPGGNDYKIKTGYITVTKAKKYIITDSIDYPEKIDTGDIDGDGMLDIVAASYTDNDVFWYKNNRDNTFTNNNVDLDFMSPKVITAVNLDEDSDIDILGGSYSGSDFVWWRNDGNPGDGSSWTEISISSSISRVNSIILFDMNNDDNIDLLTCQGSTVNEIIWWENDGSANLTPHSIGTDTYNLTSAYPGDIDNDGDIDVAAVTGGPYTGEFTWWEDVNGDGLTWSQHDIKTNINYGFSIYTADFDGDGDIDIVGTEDYGGYIYWWENVDITGSGSGNGSLWNEYIIDSYASGPKGLTCLDYDDDGDIDIIAAIESADQITLWENDGSGSFIKYIVDNNFDGARNIHLADINGDGKEDIIASSSYYDTIAYWDLFCNIWPSHPVNDASFVGVNSIITMDFNDDDYMDVLGAAITEDDLVWWENDGEGNFTKYYIEKDFDGAKSIDAADFDNDGDYDILGGGTTAISWWENNGNGDFSRNDFETGSGANAPSVHIADIDGDGFNDAIAAHNYYIGTIVWWKNNGIGGFNTSINITQDSTGSRLGNPTCIYTVDIDKDDDFDVISASQDFTGGYTVNICWFENDNGSGTSWTEHIISDSFEGASSVYPVDIDSDGDSDILASASTDNRIVWYENEDQTATPGSGDGSSFIEHEIMNNFNGASSVYAIDIDNDGDKDVVATASTDNLVALWLNYGDGVFSTTQVIATDFTDAVSVQAAEIDNDGDIDILGAAKTDDDIFWWENNIKKFGP